MMAVFVTSRLHAEKRMRRKIRNMKIRNLKIRNQLKKKSGPIIATMEMMTTRTVNTITRMNIQMKSRRRGTILTTSAA